MSAPGWSHLGTAWTAPSRHRSTLCCGCTQLPGHHSGKQAQHLMNGEEEGGVGVGRVKAGTSQQLGHWLPKWDGNRAVLQRYVQSLALATG